MDLFQLLESSADAIEVDGHFIRNFGIDPDGMYEVEENEDLDAIVLHAEMIDEDFNKWEYFFTYRQLIEAERNNDGSWVIDYHGELVYFLALSITVV